MLEVLVRFFNPKKYFQEKWSYGGTDKFMLGRK